MVRVPSPNLLVQLPWFECCCPACADFASCQSKERLRNALRVRVGEKRILGYLYDTLQRYIYTLASKREGEGEAAAAGSGGGDSGGSSGDGKGKERRKKVHRKGRKDEL